MALEVIIVSLIKANNKGNKELKEGKQQRHQHLSISYPKRASNQSRLKVTILHLLLEHTIVSEKPKTSIVTYIYIWYPSAKVTS